MRRVVLDVELERRAVDHWVAYVPGLSDVRRRLDGAVSEKIALDPIGVLRALTPRGRRREKLQLRVEAAG
jgi:hypothetical protein